MKRPFIFITVALFFPLLFTAVFSHILSLVLAAVLLVTAILLFVLGRKKPALRRVAVLFCISVFAIGYMLLTLFHSVLPVTNLSDKTVNISAVVIEEPNVFGDKVVYKVKTDSVSLDGAPQEFRMLLYSSEGLYANPFEKIHATVYFSGFEETIKNTYYSENIFIKGYIQSGSATVTAAENSPGQKILQIPIAIRSHIRKILYTNLGFDDASLLSGIIIGDRSGFSEELTSQLNSCGLSHITAVSGLHFTVICSGLLGILSRLGLGRRSKNLITLAVAFFVTAAVGFTPSVCRAAIMFAVFLLGNMIMRKGDILNSLGISGTLLFLINPFNALNISFQLSFLSTLGLILVSPAVYKKMNRIPFRNHWFQSFWNQVAYGFAATVGAVLFTLPVTALTFTNVSVISPLTNLLVVLPSSATLLLTIGASVVSAVPFLGFIGFPFFLLAGIISKYMRIVTEWCSALPVTTISFYEPYAKLCLGFAMVILVCAIGIGRKNRRFVSITLCSCLMVVMCGVLSYNILGYGTVKVAVMDTDGISAAVSSGGNTAVIGCGENAGYRMHNYLKTTGRKPDIVILPMLNNTFSGGAVSFLQKSKAEQLLLAEDGKNLQTFESVTSARKGSAENAEIQLDGHTKLKVIPTKSGNSTAVFANNKYILICPPSLDLSELPEEYGLPDVIICTRAIPLGLSEDSPPVIVVAGTEENGMIAAKRLGLPVYLTGGTGNIMLSVGSGGNLSIGREN